MLSGSHDAIVAIVKYFAMKNIPNKTSDTPKDTLIAHFRKKRAKVAQPGRALG